ncbi:MAG: tRNA pseudouridine(55) synthase TruB [Anaerolineae bacterium]|nr:tRNA pseudouridine(55) synthase TruB [Anaerolineae bacterium]
MDGVLNINKPAGMTSHDVVNSVRRIVHTRRVGHTGTLDPLATGVLVLLVGKVTRLARFLNQNEKGYQAVIRMGETTTTYDATGDSIACYPVNAELTEIQAALKEFLGPIKQIPPMYSAVSVNGERLYKLARKGQEVKREPRAIVIHHLEILDWQTPDLTLAISCSAGTYIRSLAYDLGEILGCGAHLKSLVRTRSGKFELSQSHSLEELRNLEQTGRLAEVLIPPDQVLTTMPAVQFAPELVKVIRYGQQVPAEIPETAEFLQAYNIRGELVAILIPAANGLWQPKIVFPED